jgi:hypothetical protein
METQKQRLIELAPQATGIELIGMVQDPDDSNTICNAESIGLEPTSWDILLRVATDEDGGWDAEDCSFDNFREAYEFGLDLAILAPGVVEFQVD